MITDEGLENPQHRALAASGRTNKHHQFLLTRVWDQVVPEPLLQAGYSFLVSTKNVVQERLP